MEFEFAFSEGSAKEAVASNRNLHKFIGVILYRFRGVSFYRGLSSWVQADGSERGEKAGPEATVRG